MSEKNTSKVDMLAAAREAQWSADTFLGPGSVKVVAPAKVNLLLAVGARREDGYHDVRNIMHAISLHDVLYVHAASLSAEDFAYEVSKGGVSAGSPVGGRESDADARVSFAPEDLPAHLAVGGPAENVLVSIDLADKSGANPDEPLKVAARDNLVFKAIDLLARELGREELERVSVRIEKDIPHQGGLGGGSSDAAAVLVALASRWGVAADDPAVEGVARRLGSDVAFFLRGACALYEGAGEIFSRSLDPMKLPVVLVKPNGGVSTPAAYRAFDEGPAEVPASVSQAAVSATRADEVPLFNNLASAAEGLAPELAEVRAWLGEQAGVASSDDVLLCGSGATTFAITDSFSDACTIAAAASARGWWARAATFTSLRAAQVPRR